ncbi:MAG: DUF3021 domain-containing protein [Clostridia bacterium]|nr:DUF3021 domain-containing protein [Clostridia bacterium]
MKNKYVRTFLQRGMTFGGFGPIVAGIVYAVLAHTVPEFTLTGGEVCLAIVSTYLLAFLQAGASVFPQIEHWPLAKTLACHFATLYAAYTACYLINTWIPFVPEVLLVFTGIFAAVYAVVWLIVYLSVRAASKKYNRKLQG